MILAAGTSARMGLQNKLLYPYKGKPLIYHCAKQYKQWFDSVHIVTGFEAERIENALYGLDINFIHNPNYETGLATSFIAGLKALAIQNTALLIALGDQIFLTLDDINSILATYQRMETQKIIIPHYKGLRGHPIIFPAHIIQKLSKLWPAMTGRDYIKRHPEHCYHVNMKTNHCILDIDTPDDIAQHLLPHDT